MAKRKSLTFVLIICAIILISCKTVPETFLSSDFEYKITTKENQTSQTDIFITLISREISTYSCLQGTRIGTFKPSKDTINFSFYIDSTKEIETIFTFQEDSFNVKKGKNEVGPADNQIINTQSFKKNSSLKIKALNTGIGTLSVNIKEKENSKILDTVTYSIFAKKFFIVTIENKNYVYDDFLSLGIMVLLPDFNQERKVCTGLKVTKGICNIEERNNLYYLTPKSDCTVMPIFEDLLPNETVYDWYERNNIPYFIRPIENYNLLVTCQG